jgi:2-polyprenyl-3-methyl-5-hydroxy-6-metoxy-1,4-benzoquinol methylase
MFDRVPEPALMEGRDQCEYYNQEFIDYPEMIPEFIEQHNKFAGVYHGHVIDLGSGSCNFVIELCKLYSQLSFTCYEASKEMIKIARQNIAKAKLEHRITIVEDDLFNAVGRFDLVIANRVLHHVNDTEKFWKLINSLSNNVLVCDLERPNSLDDFQDSFSEDLKNSFMAAYTVEEVTKQVNNYNYNIVKEADENGLCTFVVFTNKDT